MVEENKKNINKGVPSEEAERSDSEAEDMHLGLSQH